MHAGAFYFSNPQKVAVMDIWPEVDLTEYERLFVRTYKTVAKINGKDKVMQGVLKRTYTRYLINIPDGQFFIAPIFETSVKVSRRARIFGIVFGGDVSAWSIRLQNSAGTLFTINTDPTADNRMLVSSMIPGSNYNFFSQVSIPPIDQVGPPALNFQEGSQSFPLLIEPNWELMQNDTFIINGLCHYPSDGETPIRSILSMTLHVWEFPGMNASTADRIG
jgi:hypothetical protein